MDAAAYAQVKAIYLEIVDLTPREQRAHLDRACADAPALRAAVEGLLSHTHAAPLVEDPPPPDDPLRIRGRTLGAGWQIGACVADGGFSHVYRGADTAGRPVAIKVLKPGPGIADHAAVREAFTREASLLQRLARHETAVVEALELVEFETERGAPRHAIVMEWLDGAELGDLMRAEPRPWPLAEILTVLGPVARTLALAHAEGIAHRDIKPENIFVVGEGAARTSRLFDFGVAKVAALYSRGFDSTNSAFSAFTLAYAAPEQISGLHGPTGPRTDVYALALVVAELLGGARPTRRVTAAMMAATLDPKQRPIPADLPRPVTKVLQTALAVEPRKRHADAGAFWTALEAAHQGRTRWWRRG